MPRFEKFTDLQGEIVWVNPDKVIQVQPGYRGEGAVIWIGTRDDERLRVKESAVGVVGILKG